MDTVYIPENVRGRLGVSETGWSLSTLKLLLYYYYSCLNDEASKKGIPVKLS
jgi:hypothetical protein